MPFTLASLGRSALTRDSGLNVGAFGGRFVISGVKPPGGPGGGGGGGGTTGGGTEGGCPSPDVVPEVVPLVVLDSIQSPFVQEKFIGHIERCVQNPPEHTPSKHLVRSA